MDIYIYIYKSIYRSTKVFFICKFSNIYIHVCPLRLVRSHALFSTIVRDISGPLQGHSHCISKTCLLANVKRVALFGQRFCPAYIVFILVATQVSGVLRKKVVDEMPQLVQFASEMVSQYLVIKGFCSQTI